jgi:glycerophosphoryl diester phosphodiesterase
VNHAANGHWLVDTPIAHRGLHDLAGGRPENSIAAFEAAAQAGYAIELDVQLCADGVPIVFHDLELARLTGVGGRVDQWTARKLGQISLARTHERIPTLVEVLQLVAGRAPLLIELKNEGIPGAMERAVAQALGRYQGPFAIQSFNPRTVNWFRLHLPHVLRGQLAGDMRDARISPQKRFVLRHMLLNPRTRPDFIAYDVRCLPATSAALWRRSGHPVLAWTVRCGEDLAKARAFADNVIFELIDPLKRN